MIIVENDTSLLGEDIDRWFTTTYRQLNPFIDENGEWEFFGYKAIDQVPIIKDIMGYMSKQKWIQSWELMESPFWQKAIPIVIATGLTFLSAGIITAICPTFYVPMVGNINLATYTIGGTNISIAQAVGGILTNTVFYDLTQAPLNEYYKRVAKLNYENRIAELNKAKKELEELSKLVDEKNKLQIQKEKQKVENELNKLKNFNNISNILSVLTGTGLAIVLMNVFGGN